MLSALKRLATPRSAGFALGASAAAYIVVNATLLQSRPHPDPWFATREQEPVEEAARPAPSEVVREAQEALSALFLYEGKIDGIAGSATRAAILDFERVAGLAGTGEATPALLAELARAAEPAHLSALPPPPRPADDSEAGGEARVAAVQKALARAAYGPLKADGVAGSRTREAISQFQMDHGMPVTGEIDDALMEKLAAVGALEEEGGEDVEG